MAGVKDKLRRKQAFEYSKDYTLCASLAYHWRQLRPDSDEIKALCLSLIDMHKYTQGLEKDIQTLTEMLDDTNN